ncbi:MAG TPA: rhamnulokinase family protein [Polyangiaceae bacterium]|nr:rhamnulokinase family protein [Polyangiaceae bacterium]
MGDARSCAAIDLGASTGRVVVVDWDGDRLALREARRFVTPRLRDPITEYECWDVDAIEVEIRAGLARLVAEQRLDSVGVDGWGVDFVLLDADRRRIGPAVSYRDERTRESMPAVLARLPADEIYRRTGIQFLPFNTLYQLAATAARHASWLERARHLLLLPDYFHHRLCGALANEYSNATTTQLFGLAEHDWDDELLRLAGISRALLTDAVPPGTLLGEATLEGGRRVRVAAPATHDTGSAVASIPLAPGEAYLISGTWSLMGVESERAIAGDLARRLGFTNEGGVERRYRVLKNIAGLWLLQRLAHELDRPEAELARAAEQAPAWRSLIDPDDARFLNPPSMVGAVQRFCVETGQPEPSDPGSLARSVLDSLALACRRVKGELEQLLERPLERLRLVGGGGQNALLNQLTADACELPLAVGPAESSALGNACVQLVALGAFRSIGEARAAVQRSFPTREVAPRGAVPDAALERFARLPSRAAPTAARAAENSSPASSSAS